MRTNVLGCLTLGLALLGTAGCAGAAGDGAALSPRSAIDQAAPAGAERSLLAAGDVVTRPLDFERGESHYVGGIARGVVRASPERVLAAIHDVHALRSMLPHTKQVELVDATGPSRRIELLQGNSLVEAKYTVKLSPDGRPGELGFRLDPSRPHDIDDVYGYFKVERFDDEHSVVTVAAAVDVGSSLTQFLFGKKVQDVILATPHAMRDYFARSEPKPATPLVAANR
jgi:carbon monoxide dehydrogenase subunit G